MLQATPRISSSGIRLSRHIKCLLTGCSEQRRNPVHSTANHKRCDYIHQRSIYHWPNRPEFGPGSI